MLRPFVFICLALCLTTYATTNPVDHLRQAIKTADEKYGDLFATSAQLEDTINSGNENDDAMSQIFLSKNHDASMLEVDSENKGDKGNKPAAQLPGKPRLTGASKSITADDAECVICQYIIQRIHGAIIQYSTPGTILLETDVSLSQSSEQKSSHSQSHGSSVGPNILLDKYSDIMDELNYKMKHVPSMDTSLLEKDATTTSSDRTAEFTQKMVAEDQQIQQQQLLQKQAEQQQQLQYQRESKQQNIEQREMAYQRAKIQAQQDVQHAQKAHAQPLPPHHAEQEQQVQEQEQEHPEALSLIEKKKSASKQNGDFKQLYYQDYHLSAKGPPAVAQDAQESLPRRYRVADALHIRPSRFRYTFGTGVSPAAREYQRAQYEQMFQTIYRFTEHLCTTRMPQAYLPYCGEILDKYRFVAQGLHFGDRPDQICMFLEFCSPKSYIRWQVHSMYTVEPGDAKPVNMTRGTFN